MATRNVPPRPNPAAFKKQEQAEIAKLFPATAPATTTVLEAREKLESAIDEILEFALEDVMALPEMDSGTARKVFTARGRTWPIVLKTDGMTSAESFFALSSTMEAAKSLTEMTFMLPDGREISITSGAYIGGLALLEALAVKPAFSMEEWAIFGHKLGGKVMDELFGWAAEINGLTEEIAKKELDDAGEGSGAEE